MPEGERLEFLAEGMPAILASAEGFWAGAQALADRPREADVLEGFAAEEAAKILILLDFYRCPDARRAGLAGKTVRRFYDHLARLLYVDAVVWRPVTKGELRSYVDRERQSHIVDGPMGEWVMAAGPVIERERRLYADVERYDEGVVVWNEPYGFPPLGDRRPPDVLRLAIAMRNLGFLSPEGMRVIRTIWGAADLSDGLTLRDTINLKWQTLWAAKDAGLNSQTATDGDVRAVCETWPFPMWDFDLGPLDVPLAELEAERDRNLAAEIGDWRRASEWL